MNTVTDNNASNNDAPVGPPPFLVRRRTTFTWVIPTALLVVSLLLHKTYGGWTAYGAGIVLVMLGEAVRFWAAGTIAKDQQIATGGPYAFVRNPLYFGSLLLSVGYGLVSGLGVWGAGAMLALFLVFHMAAILYEEKFLTATFGGPYLDYVRRVPRLLPSLLPRTTGEAHFAWAQAVKNREPQSAAFAVAFVLLLSLRFLVH